MEEKYVAVLFEKINFDLENGLCFFVPIELLTDCEMDLEDDVIISKTGKTYLPMDDGELLFSDDKLCFGYPMSIKDLEKNYPEIEDEQELLMEYFDELSENVFFGKYNEQEDKVDLVLSHKEGIMNTEDEGWFNRYVVSGSNNGQVDISLTKQSLLELNKCLENKEYDRVNQFFKDIISVVNELETTISETKEIEISSDDSSTENSIDKALEKLNNLIGLENVKKEVMRLVKYLTFKSKVKDKLELPETNLHMFFTGNPGTGKTTVARIISEILYNLGYVKKNNLVEIKTKDLIGKYVGETAVKTDELLKKNKGSVIFIDEAYSFASEAQEYGQEALVEIIKEMEKNETVFIFAGYKDEMKKFMEMNPGLASRTGYYIDYKDYSTSELYEIFKGKVTKSKMQIIPGGGVEKKILSIIEDAKKQKHFGNGRFIDNLFNKILLQHSINTENIETLDALITITDDDINDDLVKELLYSVEKKQAIGFNLENDKVKKKIPNN